MSGSTAAGNCHQPNKPWVLRVSLRQNFKAGCREAFAAAVDWRDELRGSYIPEPTSQAIYVLSTQGKRAQGLL